MRGRLAASLMLVACGASTPFVAEPPVPTGSEAMPTPWEGDFVALDAGPCVIDSIGDLHCFPPSGSQLPRWVPGPYVDVTSFESTLKALRPDGSVDEIQCLTGRACGRPVGPLQALPHYTWGVRTDGSITDLRQDFVGGTPWLVATQGPLTLYREGVLVRDVEWAHFDYSVDPSIEPVEVAAMFTRAACLLDRNGAIWCDGPGNEQASFTSPPYRMLRGDLGGVCAVRQSDGIVECSTGVELDFGEVRLLAVGWDVGVLSVCAVNTDNAILCHNHLGHYYGIDLPGGDGEW